MPDAAMEYSISLICPPMTSNNISIWKSKSGHLRDSLLEPQVASEDNNNNLQCLQGLASLCQFFSWNQFHENFREIDLQFTIISAEFFGKITFYEKSPANLKD